MTRQGNEFSRPTRDEIAKAAMYFCSRCLRLTGYAASDGKARVIAEAAHQLPAGKKGPRTEELDGEESDYLKSEQNGIWLCRNCHRFVDDNDDSFPVAELRAMKLRHERRIRSLVGKDFDVVLLTLRNDVRSPETVRNLVSFLDDRRVLFGEMDNENAGFAFDSAQVSRYFICHPSSWPQSG